MSLYEVRLPVSLYENADDAMLVVASHLGSDEVDCQHAGHHWHVVADCDLETAEAVQRRFNRAGVLSTVIGPLAARGYILSFMEEDWDSSSDNSL